MNTSNFVHAAFAVVFQVAIGCISDNWLAGGMFAIGWFISREHASRQYHLAGWVIGPGGKSIKEMEPWEGMDMTKWGKDSTFDWLLATVAVSVVYVVARYGSQLFF